MDDNDYPGPMTMVKIDGAKIKRLREQQGLTQLYLATAVQVTTDTISRWENRRYPSIKKENGLKLAEALNVGLKDLFEDEEAVSTPRCTEERPGSTGIAAGQPARPALRRIWPVILLSTCLLAVLFLFIWSWQQAESPPAFSARRIVPPHCIGGQPFPVILQISGDPNRSAAIIVEEALPDRAALLSTSPNITSGGVKNGVIKWLKKINGRSFFAYVIRIDGEPGASAEFSGTVAVGGEAATPLAIGGNRAIQLGKHHWADSDRDNRISDSEILAVYDRYSEITDIDLNLDMIEEIWLGSGYLWNDAASSFTIRE